MSKKQKKVRSVFHKTINWFVGVFIAFLLIFIILFGFSQTQSFRDYLRDTIVEEFDSTINGSLKIESIEGSIFTSLKLNNIQLYSQFDTIASINKLEVHISPLQLLLQKIYIREIIGDDIQFNLIEVKPGLTNLASLSKAEKKVHDTTAANAGVQQVKDEGSSFPFSIQVNSIELSNLAFVKKSNQYIGQNNVHDFANFDDLSLNEINLKAKALADIAGNDYQIVINNFSGKSNIRSLNVNSLAGAFHVSKDFVEVNKFNLITDSSNISFDCRLDNFNLFAGVELSDFYHYPVNLNLKAKPFAFYDLSRFVTDTDFLKGSPVLELNAGGTFGDLIINTLKLDYVQSNFNITGLVQNLHTPENLYIKVDFRNSSSNFSDVNRLLPSLDLPDYSSLNITDFSLSYEGQPTKFECSFDGNVGDGKLVFDSELDFSGQEFVYDVDFTTEELDVSEVINSETLLTTQGKLKGFGTDPTKIQADFNVAAFNSNINGYVIDSLYLDLTADSKVIQLNLSSIVNSAGAEVTGRLDLTDEKVPIYNLTGSFNNLDLSKFIYDEDFVSSLNFRFTTIGKGLELDNMTGSFNLNFDESMMKSNYFEKANVELDLKKDGEYREIDLISDFVDFTISGEFLLQDAVDLLSYQSDLTTNIISRKLSELNPISEKDSIALSPLPQIDTMIVNKGLEFEFEFEFKDFDLIALLIGQEELGIEGFGSGNVSNTSSSFSINTDVELDYFYTLAQNDLLYLSNLETNLNFTKDNSSNSFNNLFGALSIGSDRIVAGSKVRNFTADFIFNQSKLIYNFSTEVDTFLTSTLDGSMELIPGNQLLEIDNVVIDYKDVAWRNNDTLSIELSNDSLFVESFELFNDSAFIRLKGLLAGSDKNDLVFEAGNLPGNLITYYAFDLYDENFSANSQLTTDIKGTLDKPEISLDFQINDIIANQNNLGNFQLVADYFDNNLDFKFDFLDSLFNFDEPYFSAVGNIPINLDGGTSGKPAEMSKLFNIFFKADSFDVATIGNIIPTITDQEGYLNCNLEVNGFNDKIELDGSLEISNLVFLSKLNHLLYKAEASLQFSGNTINVSEIKISNLRGSRLIGTLNGEGSIRLDGFNPDEIDISINGGLGVLGFRSRSVSPAVYGNLFIEAKNTWKYTYRNKLSRFDGNVLLRGMDLVYAPIQTGYTTGEDVNYVFKVDSSKIDKEELKFERLVLSKTDNSTKRIKTDFNNFDYLLNFEIEDQSKIDFILSSSFNQKLSVLADGDMRFASVGGQTSAQGQFNLLDGSKLEFFKVLDAEGFIRFDANIANPYLDIIATYNTIYTESSGTSTPVAVKININGNYDELGKNLSSNSDNIRVYSGQRNIDDNIPDLRYDAKNALSFILIGKPNFTVGQEGGDLTSDIARETANSFLGAALTSLVNSRIGDAINDIQLSSYGQYTRFDVSGKIKNVRYSFGSNTKNIQDLNRANLKIEYLFNQNFLIRAERKSPLRDITGDEVKISELGLRYIFVF